MGADLKGADLKGADLRYVNLRYADLSGADLRYADLNGADLRGAKHNEQHLASALGLRWDILFFNDSVTVGCQKHTYKEWRDFSKDEIAEMDEDALTFYPTLLQLILNEYGF